MGLRPEKSADFVQDFARQFAWYLNQAGEPLAWRFHAALDATLRRLAENPQLGRPRSFQHPQLQGLRSRRVEPPFDKLLIFYRAEGGALQAIRLMHGARDLPRRLAEPPVRF